MCNSLPLSSVLFPLTGFLSQEWANRRRLYRYRDIYIRNLALERSLPPNML